MDLIRNVTTTLLAGGSRPWLLQEDHHHILRAPLLKLSFSLWPWLKFNLFAIFSVGCYLYLLRLLIVDLRYIQSGSMRPTFEAGDRIIVDKVSYLLTAPQVNDIVIFRRPAVARNLEVDEVCIKRMVAGAGDVVEVFRGQLVVNGRVQDERYIDQPMLHDVRPVRVPAKHIFVMGDNRNSSFDSCAWGPLPVRNVFGRAVLTYWPLSRITTDFTTSRRRPRGYAHDNP